MMKHTAFMTNPGGLRIIYNSIFTDLVFFQFYCNSLFPSLEELDSLQLLLPVASLRRIFQAKTWIKTCMVMIWKKLLMQTNSSLRRVSVVQMPVLHVLVDQCRFVEVFSKRDINSSYIPNAYLLFSATFPS